MLTTHNFKMLNPAVSQTPLCEVIQGEIPKNIICSKTVDLRAMVWVEGYEALDMMNSSVSINEIFYNTGKLPNELIRQTPLIDPQLHNLYVIKGSAVNGQYIAISPAPCCGLFHEIILRDKELGANLSSQQVEVKSDRLAAHGKMVASNKGVIKSFLLEAPKKINEITFKEYDDEYVILEFQVDNFSVSTGMVGIGLPPVSVFGIFIANFLQKNNLNDGDISFAIGVHDFNAPSKNGANLSPYTNKQKSTRKTSLQGYLVMKPNTPSQKECLLKRLESDLRIAGSTLSHKRIIVSQHLPLAYWLVDMDAEVLDALNADPDSDALDIAFDLAMDGRITVPVASGFAFMGEPEFKANIPNLKHPHCWAETLFKSVEAKHGYFKEEYLYKRFSNDSMVIWQQ